MFSRHSGFCDSRIHTRFDDCGVRVDTRGGFRERHFEKPGYDSGGVCVLQQNTCFVRESRNVPGKMRVIRFIRGYIPATTSRNAINYYSRALLNLL